MKGACAKLTTIAIIKNLGKYWVGSNWCINPQQTCPRAGLPTGEGYHMCKEICEQSAHAEINACIAAGEDARGGTLYLIGHYYCCDTCREVMNKYGIAKVVIVEPCIDKVI